MIPLEGTRDLILVLAGAAFLTSPANVLVRWALRRARRVELPAGAGAGRWIGGMERLLIYLLVLASEPGAAGLVVAAKSLLRFPEIRDKQSRLPPEYVLVGSLASWLLAFGVGIVVLGLIGSG